MSKDGNDALEPAARCDSTSGVDCHACPLRRLDVFRPATPLEIDVIDRLKQSERWFEAGEHLLREGDDDGPLYTMLEGWAFRYKTLSDGRRQILNFVLPGDFIGLQQKMTDAASHGVETLTPGRACRFRRDAILTLHQELPSLGYDVTWLSARENAWVDDNLLTVGQRTAVERVAALLLTLQLRAAPFVAGDQAEPWLPLTQQHVADALGLSLVHTQRTLQLLRRRGLCEWKRGQRLQLPDLPGLARVAHLRWPLSLGPLPLL